ncbi:MAG: metallophosphoesterase family protein, partial [Chloroflexi bacterium]|nr:metallophosphoesterase family protein [Chloroflexota bacterium]
AVAEADIAVHCGDFVRMDVVEGFKQEAKRSVVVHGNTDPVNLRNAIPYVEVIEVEGKRVGVIHPAWGGPEFEPEALLPDFPEPVDIILYGHLHVPVNETKDGVLFVNPGQAYASFMVPATIAILTLDAGDVTVEIREVVPAR